MLDIVRDDDLLVQVAWLYHVGGMSQEEVGQALGISRFKVTRMLADARERGIVRVRIEHETSQTLLLGDRLRDHFGLTEVIVTPCLPPDDTHNPAARSDIARRGVGIAAAGLLSRMLAAENPVTIGIGWGRTIAAMADAITGVRKKDARFVSLMGSLTRTAATNPFDVCTRLAAIVGGEAYFLPAPFILDSEEAYRVIMNQRIVRETLEVARQADAAFVSVGECRPDALLFSSGIISTDEFARLTASGAVADTTGKFFDAEGRLVDSELNRRTPSIGVDDLARQDVVLLAAGGEKVAAVDALLRSRLVRRLVIDGDLAMALLNRPEPRP